MLTLLSRGPGFYSKSLRKLVQLEKRGYAVLTGAISTDGSREWEITEAGRVALQAYTTNEASFLARPTIRFRVGQSL
ncbi:hypothetical protein MKK64_10255 [Methylobacterium sp. E-025]|uniref:hypothetical protein n=1 Tax=Methylobacterium sp. E-025 TaxID=2836561 RepID=UPI001FBBEFD6|nr:hypothetical protein [Methylobacterium sp. E-025]MCJ2111574.1 hypothetical protein [Methylobacterium sp. E-025]